MGKVCVLVANEPRSYREVLATAFQGLRPHVDVLCVEPEDLDGEVVRLNPDLVFCSCLSEAVGSKSLAWVVLYPDGENRTMISIDGRHVTVADMQSEQLLSVIDEAELLVHRGLEAIPFK